MSSNHHHGVGALVTNASRSRFFVQQEDASHPRFPRGYGVFGRAREGGESPARALARELEEELGTAVATEVEPAGFRDSLVEIVVADQHLASLATVSVLEGERGVVVERATLTDLAFIWGLEQVLRRDLARS